MTASLNVDCVQVVSTYICSRATYSFTHIIGKRRIYTRSIRIYCYLVKPSVKLIRTAPMENDANQNLTTILGVMESPQPGKHVQVKKVSLVSYLIGSL